MNGDLPRNRVEALKLALKENSWRFVLLSLLSALFALPLFAYVFYFSFVFAFPEGNMYALLFYYLGYIPCLCLFFLGQGGLFYSLKKLSFLEGVILPEDFLSGVKKNAKESLLTGLFIGINYFVIKIFLAYLPSLSLGSLWSTVLSAIAYALLFLLSIPLLFVMPQASLYSSSYVSLYLNGWRFFLGKFLSNLGIFLMLLFPYFLFELLPYLVTFILVLLLLSLFYFAFSVFVFVLYSHSVFDRTINAKQFPELIRKGLGK